ncbi:c-type cytochrome [Flavobacterium sp. RNTU_13]|uniref:c-type cytochrome n=1 Tax=Flavobacterium sp. RNTU_13 TaxID=3375145 RepID=UPI003986F9E4
MPLFCGTKNIPEYAQTGRDIFNSNCAACHKINSTYNPINLNGPLADSIYFNRFISEQNTLKKHNKQLIKHVGKNKFYMHLFKLSPQESAALYSYVAYFVKE